MQYAMSGTKMSHSRNHRSASISPSITPGNALVTPGNACVSTQMPTVLYALSHHSHSA